MLLFNTVASQFVYDMHGPMNGLGNELGAMNGDSEVNDSAELVVHDNRYEPQTGEFLRSAAENNRTPANNNMLPITSTITILSDLDQSKNQYNKHDISDYEQKLQMLPLTDTVTILSDPVQAKNFQNNESDYDQKL